MIYVLCPPERFAATVVAVLSLKKADWTDMTCKVRVRVGFTHGNGKF